MLKVAILSSKRAPGVEAILRHPERGRLFEVVCVVATDAEFPQSSFIASHGVPVISHLICRVGDRAEYDAMTARMLTYIGVNTILLLGYRYILTEPMLSAFRNRIVNIHDSDLTIRRHNGERRFVGLHSTFDAILAGERATRSSVHLVTKKVDSGPLLMLSDPYEVPEAATDAAARGDRKTVKRFAWAQRELMMRAWGSLAIRALHQLAEAPSRTIEEVTA